MLPAGETDGTLTCLRTNFAGGTVRCGGLLRSEHRFRQSRFGHPCFFSPRVRAKIAPSENKALAMRNASQLTLDRHEACSRENSHLTGKLDDAGVAVVQPHASAIPRHTHRHTHGTLLQQRNGRLHTGGLSLLRAPGADAASVLIHWRRRTRSVGGTARSVAGEGVGLSAAARSAARRYFEVDPPPRRNRPASFPLGERRQQPAVRRCYACAGTTTHETPLQRGGSITQ